MRASGRPIVVTGASMTIHYHQLNLEETGNPIKQKAVCGSHKENRGISVVPLVSEDTMYRHTTCKKCLESPKFIKDQVTFEIGFECNIDLWREYVKSRPGY